MDLLIVFGIVVIAVWYLYRHVTGLVKQDDDQCSCSGGCGGCASNDVIRKKGSFNDQSK